MQPMMMAITEQRIPLKNNNRFITALYLTGIRTDGSLNTVQSLTNSIPCNNRGKHNAGETCDPKEQPRRLLN